MLLSSGLVGDQRGTIWEMLAKVDSRRSEAGEEEEDLKDVPKVREGLRLWVHQQHQQCYLVRTIQMRQAQSSRTKVSQLWYMMLQTCTRCKMEAKSRVCRDAACNPGFTCHYHHGYESTDVALLHDHPSKQEKGTVHGLSAGTSCQQAQTQRMDPFSD